MKVSTSDGGTGELTRVLHEKLLARSTLGIDSSPTMLERTTTFATQGSRSISRRSNRRLGVMATIWSSPTRTAMGPDNPAVADAHRTGARADGQIAVQVPANDDHPSHAWLGKSPTKSPFAPLWAATSARATILEPERYAELLDQLGFSDQHVRLQVYPHRLPSREDVVDGSRGRCSSLTRSVFPPIFSPNS